MDEQRHLATVELVEDRSEGRLAERLAGVAREPKPMPSSFKVSRA
jgi:hypothetical protein